MDRDELRARLEADGVDPDAYSLEGDPGDGERYLLDHRRGKWLVFYAERGLETSLVSFATEHEACALFYDRISRDPTVRRPPT